jgi:anti-sigma regulatory factor (Ser/Thr protein kinase)
MLDLSVAEVFTVEQPTNDTWWQQLRSRLTMLYLLTALILLTLSVIGHVRLLNEVGTIFGGFTWTIDPDSNGQVVVVSTPPQLAPFTISADSITNNSHIIAADGLAGAQGLTHVYQHAHPDEIVTYTVEQGNGARSTYTRPVTVFTFDMWWQTFGLTFLAGLSWLAVGAFLLATAPEWTGGVEGITLLPPAMLLLLYSHWGNIQNPDPPDLIVQLLWIPSFALLGAAFIHLSLTYRPEAMSTTRKPKMIIDALPYLPLLALVAYEWGSLLLLGHVPMRLNITSSLSYGVIGGFISFCIGITSLIRITNWKALFHLSYDHTERSQRIPPHVRHRIGDLLALWIGGVGLGFCFGVLPILLSGQTLLSFPIFYTLATVYPLILLYAIRSLRLIDRLHISLAQREQAVQDLQSTTHELQETNSRLQQATSLLLHADAHMRSILSQRIHDQPKQQALRIRSLLSHWQHKLRVEAEHDPAQRVAVQPVIEGLGKIRKISEELESDLSGLQMLVEDVYQRRSLGLKLHLKKLIHEDIPMLHPDATLNIQAELSGLDVLRPEFEQIAKGEKIAEAVSYTVSQALLNIYNHADATSVSIQTTYRDGILEILIIDDGQGFDPTEVAPEKTSLFKARLKARAAGGKLTITSIAAPQDDHGTTVKLDVPIENEQKQDFSITIMPENTVVNHVEKVNG